MILPLWLRTTMAATILAAVLGTGWAIHHAIWKSGWNANESAHIVAGHDAVIRRIAENHDKELADQVERLAIQKGYDNEIKNLRTRIASSDRLRIASPGCGPTGTPTPKGDSGGDGGDTGTRLVSAASQRDFDAIEFRVETVFAGCRKAQKFITDSGLVP